VYAVYEQFCSCCNTDVVDQSILHLVSLWSSPCCCRCPTPRPLHVCLLLHSQESMHAGSKVMQHPPDLECGTQVGRCAMQS
jgi:hypothetical protein